jgi:nucleoside-diphosphate-sugar epimerase
VDEAWPPRPVTAYGRSKLAGEEAVRGSGAAFTIVRPPVVYGPRDRQTLQLFRLARGGFVPLLGDGLQELSLVFAGDLAEALVAAAAARDAEGRVYHAAHPEIVTQRALMAAIAQAVGARPRLIPVPESLVRSGLAVAGALLRLSGQQTVFDPAKAPELLAAAWTCATDALARDAGWRARVPLAQGLAETTAWYRQAGWL